MAEERPTEVLPPAEGELPPSGALAHWRAVDATPHHLRDHLKGVGSLTASFATKLSLAEAGELIGLLHDFGKYSLEFQAYIRSATGLKNPDEDDYVDADSLRGKIDHSTAGAQHVWSRLMAAAGSDQKAMIAAQALALCIASHHSGLIDSIGSDGASGGTFGEDRFSRRMTKPEDRVHIEEARRNADAEVLARAEELLSNQALIGSFWAAIETRVSPRSGEGSGGSDGVGSAPHPRTSRGRHIPKGTPRALVARGHLRVKRRTDCPTRRRCARG